MVRLSLSGPRSSAICAVTMFEEWISVSGTLSEAPRSWLSLMVKPPIGIGRAE